MSKKFTSLLVLVAAILLAVPVQAQIAKKAAKQQIAVLKTGPVKSVDFKKAKAAKMKSEAQLEGQAFTGKMFNYLQASLEKVQDDKVVLEKQMEENLRGVKNGKRFSLLSDGKVSTMILSNPRVVTFNANQVSTRRASHRAEVVDAAGIITSPAEGEHKFYTRSGTAYYVSNNSVYSADQSGHVEIVECADGTIYIKDIVTRFAQGAWVKGTKTGNTITLAGAQPQLYNSNYDTTLSVNWATINAEGDSYDRSTGDITFTVDDAAGTITLNGSSEEKILGIFWDDDNAWSGYGDYGTVWTADAEYEPASTTLVELPAGAEVAQWYAEGTGSTAIPSTVKVSFVGNDVYVAGLHADYPDSWIKGTLNGNTVTFSSLQFVGTYRGTTPIWVVGADPQTSGLTEAFTMTYDALAKTLSLDAGQLILFNAAEDRMYYLSYIDTLTLSQDAPTEPEAETAAPVDAVPYSNALNTAELFAQFGVLDSNKDGSTWIFSTDDGTFYRYHSTNPGDDWLISPAIKLEAGKAYHFAIDVASTSFPEKFEVLIGTEAKASALTIPVIAATELTTKGEYITYQNEAVTVGETGYYHFGIHAISDADQYRLMVKNFLVEAGAEPTAPAAVNDFAVAQTPDKLEAVLSFTAPTKTVAGEELTENLTKVDVLRNGEVIKSITASSINWDASAQGYENQQGVESFDLGDGVTATLAGGGNSNTPKYYDLGTALRMYAKNTLTLKGTGIKKVVFTMTGNDKQKLLTADKGDYALDGNVGTWTGSADEVVFSVPDGSGNQARIQSIVVEYGEGVAPGSAISYVDNDEDLTIGTYVYQIIPYNASGAGLKSEEKSIFLSVALDVPHIFDFSQNLLEWFQVIDNNADNKTWAWSESNGAYYGYSSTNAADDYLISLPFNLKAGTSYNVIVNAKSGGYPEKFEVKAGKTATVEGLTETVIPETTIAADVEGYNDYEGVFTPTEDGQYHFAIHATSDADMFNLSVSTLTIELAPLATAPAAIADLTATAGAEGALEATLAFTAPAKAINGDALTGNVDVKVYRDKVLVNTIEGVAPGAATTWKDTNIEASGTYTYYVVAANADGDGLKSEKVSLFVGEDVLGNVENITVTGTTANSISLSWDEVAGLNGGYVDKANVKYAAITFHVEQVWFFTSLIIDEVLGTVSGQTNGTFDYAVDEGEQDYKYFGVMALKADDALPEVGSEYDGGYTWALTGAPYDLPFLESFAGGQPTYSLWAVDGSAENTLGLLAADASDADGGALAMTTVEEPGLVRLESARININGIANPTLLFDVKGVDVTTAKVFASKDDGAWEVIQTVDVTADYTTVKVPLLNAKGERFIRFAIGADIVNPAIVTDIDAYGDPVYEYHDLLFVDNIKVVDLYQYNLKADIKAQTSVVAGQKAKVVATVTNDGENAAEDYIVTIKAGEKVLTNVIANEPLAPFATDEITLDFETSVFDEAGAVALTVDVEFENELFPDDNSASTIITVKEPTAIAPASLAAVEGAEGIELTWAMPADEQASARAAAVLTEEFEDTEVFEPFSLGGITADVHTGSFGDWTLYDGNGITVYGFNGLEFPNAYQPAAWQVVSTAELPALAENNYTAHSGDQYLWSFCPADQSGAPAADHWLISPELSGDAQTISFYARAITAKYGAETFEILASSTDNAPESFTIVGTSRSLESTEWTEVTADLPAGTRYFAIRHTSTDIFGMFIDDVTFAANGEAPAPTSFNIYYNGEKIANVEGDKTSYTIAADKVALGEQTFAVSAVYANGTESRPVTATITVTGIEQIAADGQVVDVYAVDGKLVRSQAKNLDGLKGIYIVNGKKVMVK